MGDPPASTSAEAGSASASAYAVPRSLLIETIPKHREFSGADAGYIKLKQVGRRLLADLGLLQAPCWPAAAVAPAPAPVPTQPPAPARSCW